MAEKTMNEKEKYLDEIEDKIRTIGVLTSGGDAPGMNAAIRAVVRRALAKGLKVRGIRRGYHGLLKEEIIDLTARDVSDIVQRGGTILQTARCKTMRTEEGQQKAAAICKKYGIDGLVVIGGDGSFAGAQKLANLGVNTIGVPGTIDLDIACTDYTIGFDTAVNTAMYAIDKVRDTSTSHERCSVIEVMGRDAGYLALWCGIANGAERILMPEEHGFDEKALIEDILENKKRGKQNYIIINAEGVGDSINLAKRIEDMGANSICVKDMAGLLVPYQATELVTALKEAVSIPIEMHTHYTSGVASMTYLKSVEAGADIIDTAMSPFALGTSQPATEVMVETFKGTPYDTGLDQNLLAEIADYFRPIRDDALESGLLNPKNLGVNIKTLLYQVPGGMLSNLTSQLKEQGAEDKFYEVLEEVPRVRKDLGEPPLVTPSSQIVGTQAVFNVLMGERYKMVTKETKDVLAGKYGKTTKPVDPELQKKALGDVEPITCRPADLIPDELDTLREECKQWIQQDEDVLTYALFPQVAVDFFKYRQAQQTKVDATVADTENGAYPV